MLAQLTASQWAEWCTFYEIEPWGAARDDFRFGQVAANIANYAGKSRKPEMPQAHPADFFKSLEEFRVHAAVTSDAMLLSDPVEQSNLIRRVLFKKKEE